MVALDGRALLAFARQRREKIGRRITELRSLEVEAMMLDRMIEAGADTAFEQEEEARVQ